MKKFIVLMCLIGFFCLSLNADEYIIYSGDAYQYNEFLKGFTDAQFLIKYSDEEKVYYLFTSDILNKSWININAEQLDSIQKTISKYLDWVKIATEKKIEIDKPLPDSEIDTSIAWKYGDDWYSSEYFQLYFSAFSQNVERHQLVISSNKVDSESNQFVSIKLDTLYLDSDQAISFLNGIKKEVISEIIEEHNNKKNDQDLFN